MAEKQGLDVGDVVSQGKEANVEMGGQDCARGVCQHHHRSKLSVVCVQANALKSVTLKRQHHANMGLSLRYAV